MAGMQMVPSSITLSIDSASSFFQLKLKKEVEMRAGKCAYERQNESN